MGSAALLSSGMRRIAIVRLSAIGDVVHGLPLARSLRRLHPGARISWIVQSGPAPLLRGHPWIDRTLLFPRRGGPAAIARFLLALGRERFDLAADLQGNLKSGLVLAATRAPLRFGLARAEYREAPGSLAANRFAPSPAGPHSVDRTLSLARAVGDPAPVAEFGLSPTPAERDDARRDLAAVADPAVAISVGGADDVREWTDEGYVRTARALFARGRGVVVLAGPAHAARARRIAGAAGAVARAGTTDLRGLLAHLAVLAGRPGAALLACDSAPLHLAVAVGLRVVALAGPQDPERTGPWGTRAIRRWDGLSCAPCRKRVCAHSEDRACMRRIPWEEVVAGICEPSEGRDAS